MSLLTMLTPKLTSSDLMSVDRIARAVNPLQTRSEFEDSNLYRSASGLRSLRSAFSEWRDRRLSGARITQKSSFLDRASSTLPDTSQITTADNTITTFSVNTRQIAGSLRADLFRVGSDARTVISGNGNVDFGNGYRDLLDLSTVASSSVNFSWANQAGVVYNPGTGSRVFDAINFSDGRQILFEGLDAIQFADGVLNLSVTPNDPLFSQQWNLHMMGVHTAWRFTTGNSNVLIGVQDTGLVLGQNGAIHPDLSRTYAFWNQVGDDLQNNHGTSVQGIIAADSNNGIGMSGINWNSNVLNIDVLGGEAGDLSLTDAARSMISFARQNGQRLVINMSLGRPDSFGQNFDQDFEQVVRENPDVLFVIAAGNSGEKGEGIASPAILARTYNNVISVGAVWGTETSRGERTVPGTRIPYSQYGDGLTLVAPSEVIAPTSTNLWGTLGFDFEFQFNGTSAATPNATGVASLVLGVNPSLSAGQVKDILAQTSIDVGQAGYDRFTGSGVINADAAVRRAMAISRGYG
ncbi:S8 family serine peptidase [Pseudanabaenaceae cyanobacterium LEGE 13415]|nr:S8 family serine peptidase [Pseudanabaenaceae cyanobacterium LEGE 13415]